MAHLYPIFLNLSGKRCLVIGGGKVAERKVETLLEYDAQVIVVSPESSVRIRELTQRNLISWQQRVFTPIDLDDVFMVFIATGDSETNRSVAGLCREKGILVNAVDDPDNCDFYVPAILRRKSLCVAVSTEGNSPLLAAKIRNELKNAIPTEYGEWVEILGQLRDKIKKSNLDIAQRQKVFNDLVYSDILDLLKQGRKQEIEERISECMSFLRE